jgi:hypothetical protein
VLAAALAYMHEQTWRQKNNKKSSGGMPARAIVVLRFAFRSDRPKWMAFMKLYDHDYRKSLLAIRAWERTANPDCSYIRVTLYWGYTRAATLNCHKRFISSLYFS